jgi:hypothetical protein
MMMMIFYLFLQKQQISPLIMYMRLRGTGRLQLEGMPRVRRIVRSYATFTRLISWSSPPGRLKDRIQSSSYSCDNSTSPLFSSKR